MIFWMQDKDDGLTHHYYKLEMLYLFILVIERYLFFIHSCNLTKYFFFLKYSFTQFPSAHQDI